MLHCLSPVSADTGDTQRNMMYICVYSIPDHSYAILTYLNLWLSDHDCVVSQAKTYFLHKQLQTLLRLGRPLAQNSKDLRNGGCRGY